MYAAIQIERKKLDNPFEIITWLRNSLEKKDCQIESQSHQIRHLEENINYPLQQRFGSMSERFDERQQLLFENDNRNFRG